METHGDVISFVTPLYNVLGVVGLAPFCLRNTENKSTWRHIWSCILAGVLFSMLLFRLARLMLWEIHLAGSSIQWVPTALHLLLAYSTTITSLLIAATTKYRNGVQQIFFLAKSLDEGLQRSSEGSSWQTTVQIVTISLILLPLSVATVVVWQDLWPAALTLCDIWCFLTNTLLVMQFVNSVLIFQARILAFNNHIFTKPWQHNNQTTFKNKELTSVEEKVSKMSSFASCIKSQKQTVKTEECRLSGCMKVTYTVQSQSPVKKSPFNSNDLERISISHATCTENASCIEYILTQTQKLRSIHLNLHDLANFINNTFGYQILLSLASFFNFVLLALNFTIDLVGRMVQSNESTSNGYYVSMSQEGITIFWGLWAAACTISITMNCHLASLEAENSLIVMHRATLFEVQQQTEEKLNPLFLQLLSIKIRFVAAGFFVIDLQLLHAIVAVICTYLIVIFQFRS